MVGVARHPSPAAPRAAASLTCVLLAVVGIDVLHLGLLSLWRPPQGAVESAAWLACIALAMPLRIALQHESLHGRLLPGRWNEVAGRFLASASGLAWEVLRTGHATHHRWSRHPLDRPDLARGSAPAWLAHLRHLLHLLGGMYALEWLASWAQWLPRAGRERAVQAAFRGPEAPLPALRTLLLRNVRDPRKVRSARLDVAAGLVLHGVALALWGDRWWLLAAAVLLRAALVSVMDNVAHHGTEARLHAPARNLALPRGLGRYLLHANLHETHHRFPAARWWELPRLHREAGMGLDGSYAAALLAQFAGPVRSASRSGP